MSNLLVSLLIVYKTLYTVERHLKEQFREWRRGQITRFKTDVVAQMKSLLQNFEQHQMTVGPNLSPQEAQRLLEPIQNKYSRFEVVGFPLHLPMNDLESVTSAVKSVEMHRLDFLYFQENFC